MDKNLKKKSAKTHLNKKVMRNNDSMMNIIASAPSDIHSKISYDNIKSHSSMSRDGQEVIFTMKESLRDLNTYNNSFTPERGGGLGGSLLLSNQHQQTLRHSRNNFNDERALLFNSQSFKDLNESAGGMTMDQLTRQRRKTQDLTTMHEAKKKAGNQISAFIADMNDSYRREMLSDEIGMPSHIGRGV